jgi:hypothetical protein
MWGSLAEWIVGSCKNIATGRIAMSHLLLSTPSAMTAQRGILAARLPGFSREN